MIRVQLNEKYTQINVMKTQKEIIEKKLNNVVGRAKTMRPDEAQKMQLGLEHELKCFSKTINELKLQIHQL